jgi:hypothetical protein
VTLPAPVVTGEHGDPLFAAKVGQLERWRRQCGGTADPAAIR